MVVSEANSMKMGFRFAVLAKKSASLRREARVQQHLSDNPDLRLLYTPSEEDHAFARLIQSNDSVAFARITLQRHSGDRQRPFFFFTINRRSFGMCPSNAQAMDWKSQSGSRRPRMVLLISILAVLAFLIVPLLIKAKTKSGNQQERSFTLWLSARLHPG